jgi:hypothetical protein
LSTPAVGVPLAARSSSPGWRDPRLWVGIAIVAASVLLGARLVGSADQTVAVWAVAADSAAGTEITSDDLTVARIRFDSAEEAALYLSADQPPPEGARLARDVSRGELLARSALDIADTSHLAELPLDFLDSGVAATLHRGDRVDVFLTSAATDADAAELALTDVVVLEVIRGSSSLGSSGGVQIILGVSDRDRPDLPRVVQAAGAGRVYLVAQG